MRAFVDAFRSEWLKRKRSFASTIILGGSLFTPAVILVIRLIQHRNLPPLYATESFWPRMWRDSWESMAVFFLPLAVIMATSLIVQIEFKSNGWKRVHTLPTTAAALFVTKLAVILVMLVEFLLVFNAGIFLCGAIPALLVPGLAFPKGSFLALPLMRENALYFLECLPIVAVQYLVALRSQNALIPIGIGFLAWVGALAAVSSRFAQWWPYAYTIMHYLEDKPKPGRFVQHAVSPWIAATLFVLISTISYALFVTRAEKG
jgi:lantibiotic transport system permease protein